MEKLIITAAICGAEVTKEQFDKMGIAERTKLLETNRELYESLKGE